MNPRFQFLTLVLIGTIIFSSCELGHQEVLPMPTELSDHSYTEIEVPVGFGYVSRSVDVYFTDPVDSKSAYREDGLDRVLAKAIDKARVSLDIAIYSLDNYVISYAIIRAKEKGVSVRVVVEGDNMDTQAIQNLIDNGVQVRADGQSGLMHNKFMIIDGKEIWTGSMNYTYSGVYQDHNVLICLRSEDLIENYETEFLELIGESGKMGTPNPNLMISGKVAQNLFSPEDRIAYTVVDVLSGAKSSIVFLEYTFTADDYAEILIDKRSDGLKVNGIIDARSENASGADFEVMAESDISILLADGAGLMHHKTVIIDSEIVLLGSYNFTAAAEKKNDENVLIMHDPELAKLFEQEYNRIANSQ